VEAASRFARAPFGAQSLNKQLYLLDDLSSDSAKARSSDDHRIMKKTEFVKNKTGTYGVR
jgi:hypothetical protein